MHNQSYFIKGFPDYRLVRLSESKFCVLSKKKGYWEEIGSDTYKDGHILVHLCSDNAKRATYLHILVAETFVPNPEGKTVVHHKDFDATNNDPANLMWVSPSQHREIHNTEEFCMEHSEEMSGNRNPFYGKKHTDDTRKKMSENRPKKPVEQWSLDDTTLIARYGSVREAARITGIAHCRISGCCRDEYGFKSAGGYKWRYAD